MPREVVDASTLEVFEARLSSLAQWEMSLHMAGSWDCVVFKVHSNMLTFSYSQWKAHTEQFLNMNVLDSYCKSSIYGDLLCAVYQVENTPALCWRQLSLAKCSVCETELRLRLDFKSSAGD